MHTSVQYQPQYLPFASTAYQKVNSKFPIENSSKSVQGEQKRRETENKTKRETKREKEQDARGQAEAKPKAKGERQARGRIELVVVGFVAGE